MGIKNPKSETSKFRGGVQIGSWLCEYGAQRRGQGWREIFENHSCKMVFNAWRMGKVSKGVITGGREERRGEGRPEEDRIWTEQPHRSKTRPSVVSQK